MPLLTLQAGLSSWNSFRAGSKLLGWLFALLALVLLLWCGERLRHWLNPG
jgi:hypothetical protein